MRDRAISGLAPLLLAAGLAGCGGGGGGNTGGLTSTSPDTTFTDTTNAYHAMATSVTGDTTTGSPGLAATTTMPSGTATFNGYAALLVGLPGDANPRLALVSPATLAADFAAGTVTGSASAFTGHPIDPATYSYTGSASTYSGAIALSGGCIGTASGCTGTSNPQDVSATATGTLTGGGNTVAVNHFLRGQFYGNPLSAIDLAGTSTAGTLNGAAATSSLDIVGTK